MKKKKLLINLKVLPKRALYDYELVKYADKMKIPHFRGVFMRDELLNKSVALKPWKCETGIINLDTSQGPGTHWVAYAKKNQHCEYFDSYGDLTPPPEFVKYMKNSGDVINILYNYNNIQKNVKYNCGHLCLRFLYNVCTTMFV